MRATRDEPGPDDPFAPVADRRGSWIGGPGFIFFVLLVLIGAGSAIYLQATGQLGSMLAQGGQMIHLGTTPAPLDSSTPENGGDLQSMVAAPSDAPSAPVKPLVLTPMSPAQLIAKRPPPRSLRLPVGEFDQPPVKRFARPALFLGEKPRVGVLVVGLGLNRGITAAAIADLPPEISLSFSPYAAELPAWIDAAHAYGHEVLLDLPLEPRNYPQDDPGPLGLLTALNKEENLRRLAELLKESDGVAGVATQFGDRFLGDADALRPILSEIGQRGLGFVATVPEPSLPALAAGISDAPLLTRIDRAFPQDASRQTLAAEIEALLGNARAQGRALAVIPSYPASLAALTTLAGAAKDRGMALVPASAFLQQK
ncbi:divergent polysaccharide deacetylase family protein [Dongia sp.]|uniref:divergent polysaccharide deacetylase family protein n=1 Tax=Dongia sp. TaxID=1977262 RepID=UPI0035B207A3